MGSQFAVLCLVAAPVGTHRIGGPLSEMQRRPAHAEGRRVRDHLASIGQQRERARDHAADDLDEHETEDDGEGPSDPPLVGARTVGVAMVMFMAVMRVIALILLMGLAVVRINRLIALVRRHPRCFAAV